MTTICKEADVALLLSIVQIYNEDNQPKQKKHYILAYRDDPHYKICHSGLTDSKRGISNSIRRDRSKGNARRDTPMGRQRK